MDDRSFRFDIKYRSKLSSARRGRLSTPHGLVETPAFVTVGTKGTVKGLSPEDLNLTNTKFVFSNTYHLVLSPTLEVLKKAGGIHAFSKINKPIITDSGGFQVFSLAKNKSKLEPSKKTPDSPTLVKIDSDGVTFRSHIDGKTFVFTPEFSISAQKIIGGDLVVAFDECVYQGASEKYTTKSLSRTHDWAKRSVAEFRKENHFDQRMYGVIQGGGFESLRRQSAEFIQQLPFWGLAVGGVSVGETKKEMRQQLKWVMDVVSTDLRPIHALGIGHLDDVVDMIKMGVDTFDCIVPTRDARIGKLYQCFTIADFDRGTKNKIDIFDISFKNDLSPVDLNCKCYVCENFSRAYLHHLFKQKELLAYRLSTIHNLHCMEQFFQEIRDAIERGLF